MITIDKKHIKVSRSKVLIRNKAYLEAVEASETVTLEKIKEVDDFKSSYLAEALEVGKELAVDVLNGTGQSKTAYNSASIVIEAGDTTSTVRIAGGTASMKSETTSENPEVQSTVDFLSQIAIKRYDELAKEKKVAKEKKESVH
jgi:hypothetical protein